MTNNFQKAAERFIKKASKVVTEYRSMTKHQKYDNVGTRNFIVNSYNKLRDEMTEKAIPSHLQVEVLSVLKPYYQFRG